MSTLNIPRLIISSPSSGGGKTTLTLGLAALFKRKGVNPALFKSGPDYIDHLLHKEIAPETSANLDLFFLEKEGIKSIFGQTAQACDIALIEGAMGYYDGLHGSDAEASSYELARTLESPCIFIADGNRALPELAAEILAFMKRKDPSLIKGIILNRCDKMQFRFHKKGLENRLSVPVLGYLTENSRFELKERSLGLIPASEQDEFFERVEVLSHSLEQTIDIDTLLSIAQSAPEISYDNQYFISDMPAVEEETKLKIGIARDEAFYFYHSEILAHLEKRRLELCFFSPLHDEKLPEGISGLYLGGGYPELFASELSKNESLLSEIDSLLEKGIPCIAEGGGFMYLHKELVDEPGASFGLVGAIDAKVYKGDRLENFGYQELVPLAESQLFNPSEPLKAHEYHYWQSEEPGSDFLARKAWLGKEWNTAHARGVLYAGFPQIYLLSSPQLVANFISAMKIYSESLQK